MQRHMMRTLVIAAAFLVSACGFRPLHTAVNSAGVAAPLANIALETTASDDSDDKRAAFLVRQSLESRLSDTAPEPRYRLRLTPAVSRSGLGVGRNDVASRFDYNMFVRYKLTDAASGEELTDGRVYAVATFGAPRDPYGRISAEVSAAEQAAEQAADRILLDLATYFADPDSAE